jgi:hypothetical protein
LKAESDSSDLGGNLVAKMPVFAAYAHGGSPSNFPFIGQVSPDRKTIQPVILPGQSSFLTDLTLLILLWDTVKDELELGDALPLADVDLKAPLPYRDVLCVGKNYLEHANVRIPGRCSA